MPAPLTTTLLAFAAILVFFTPIAAAAVGALAVAVELTAALVNGYEVRRLEDEFAAP